MTGQRNITAACWIVISDVNVSSVTSAGSLSGDICLKSGTRALSPAQNVHHVRNGGLSSQRGVTAKHFGVLPSTAAGVGGGAWWSGSRGSRRARRAPRPAGDGKWK